MPLSQKVHRNHAVGFTQAVAEEVYNRKVVRILSRSATADGGGGVSVEFLAGEVAGATCEMRRDQIEELLRLDTLAQARDVVSKLASLRSLEGGDERLIEHLLVESGAILSEGAWQELEAETARRLAEEAEMEGAGIFFA